MDAIQLSIDASYSSFGLAGVLDPDGIDLGVVLLPATSDGAVQFSGLEMVNPSEDGGVYRIRIADWRGHHKGAIIEIGGERRRVQSEPKFIGARRLELLLDTVPVA